jgi:phosphatidylglycerol:prolipoprotein diacylglycerol transferase
MYPILGRYGPFFLYSFSVVLWFGIAAGISLTAWNARQKKIEGWFDAMTLSLATGLMGGRIGFVIAHWSYYQARQEEMWQLWRGGLNYHGALFGGMLGLWAWSSWRGTAFRTLADQSAPALALLSAFGWVACWLEGCASGRIGPIGLLTADLPDSFGVYDVRYQTQLLALTFSLLVLVALYWLNRRPGKTPLFWLALLGLSLGRAVVSGLRGDTVPLVEGVRLDLLVDAALALVSLVLIQYQRRTPVYASNEDESQTTVEGD